MPPSTDFQGSVKGKAVVYTWDGKPFVRLSRIIAMLEKERRRLKGKALFHPELYITELLDRVRKMK